MYQTYLDEYSFCLWKGCTSGSSSFKCVLT